MLSLNKFSFEFGGTYLYKETDWHIKPRERIGLVGRNGTGKSTLLKLITGDYELREGTISKQKGLSIGYLHQDMVSYNPSKSIRAVAMEAFDHLLEVQKEIDQLIEVVEHDYSDENINRLGELQQKFEAAGGYTMQSTTEEILEGLGFKTAELDQALSEFSGGWRMRVILARMLLQEPDLLLLDEPTNHLDLPSIVWLENYLKNYSGTVIIVSHDRSFLNQMVTKIVEVANKKLYIWEGNYDFFLKAKKERDDLQSRQYENQQQYIKEQEKFINRFRAKASKAKAVQSRVKMLDKLEKVENIEEDNAAIKLRFGIKKPSGKVLSELEEVKKWYGDKEVIKEANGSIIRQDKIALIGANGMGKSTLLRIIAGTESYKGEVKEGHNVLPSFYAQHQLESLTLENEILDEMKSFATSKSETELRSVLGCFLFSGDDVFKKIKVLSGGEKARVALAKTLVSEANFLLLDEPTNHLDIQAIEVLIEALQNYEGSFILVSHDRYFVSRVANKIWYIDNKILKEYPGTYKEYQYWQSKQEAQTKSQTKTPVKKEKKSEKKETNSGTKEKDRAIKKVKNQMEQAEKRLNEWSAKIRQIEEQLASPEVLSNPEELLKYSNLHQEAEAAMKEAEEEYEQFFEQLIELEE